MLDVKSRVLERLVDQNNDMQTDCCKDLFSVLGH